MTGVVGLVPDLARASHTERLPHEGERMNDELLVVVAIGIGDARHRQAIFVLVVVHRTAVALLRSLFANDLQPALMVVALHFAQQCFAPQTALVGLRAGPDDRQRTLTHVGVAAEKILASVGVI